MNKKDKGLEGWEGRPWKVKRWRWWLFLLEDSGKVLTLQFQRRRSGNNLEEPEMIKERKERKLREKETVMTTEDNITGYNLRRMFWSLWMESCNETRLVIVVEVIIVKSNVNLVKILKLMEEWMKRLVCIWWQGW